MRRLKMRCHIEQGTAFWCSRSQYSDSTLSRLMKKKPNIVTERTIVKTVNQKLSQIVLSHFYSIF